jgi:hypothetical protein
MNDKEIEKNRYNNSAIGALENNSILNIDELMLPYIAFFKPPLRICCSLPIRTLTNDSCRL